MKLTTCYTIIPTVILLLQYTCITPCNGLDLFGRNKRKEAKEAKLKEEKRAKVVVFNGIEFDKKIFYACTTVAATLFSVLFSSGGGIFRRRKQGNRPGGGNTKDILDVVVVGCGLPKKSMQFLEMSNVNVRAIVEPYYLDKSLSPTIAPSFQTFASTVSEMGVEFVSDLNELQTFRKPTLCVIAGRTLDNPKLFQQCIEKGALFIYLEKPGARTVDELTAMKQVAEEHGVQVYMGYNKNVSSYIQQAIKLSNKTPKSQLFLSHSNSYTASDLPEVFARNAEGMLKNMVIHELAILVTYFNVTVENVDKFIVNTHHLFSERLTVCKPGTSMPHPEYISDFSRVAFKITTKGTNGVHVSIMADRSGGTTSFAVVRNEHGIDKDKFVDTDVDRIASLVQDDPDMMPYFFIQSNDYQELKNRVVLCALEGNTTEVADGVATIGIGIEAMRLADFATQQLNKALQAD